GWAGRPGPLSAAAGGRADRGSENAHSLPRQRRPQRAQALARERAGDDHRVGLFHQTTLPERQRGGISGRLGDAATAVQAYPGERVAPVAARAVRAAGETHADRTDEAVL